MEYPGDKIGSILKTIKSVLEAAKKKAEHYR